MRSAFRGPAVAAALILLALAVACSKSPTRPPVTEVRASVTVEPSTGSPSNPVTMVFRAENAGTTQLWHCSGCGCGNGTSVTVLGPDGIAVALSDPLAVRPLCPDGDVPFQPGEVLGNGARFTGVLYVKDSTVPPSPTYAAPAGRYTVVATLTYAASHPGEAIGITRRATFDWIP